MPVYIKDERPGPVDRYSDKTRPTHRLKNVFHPVGKMDLWRWAPVPDDKTIPQVPPPVVLC